MPELPDVEGFRRVAQRADGQYVRSVRVHDPQVVHNSSADEFVELLRGTRVHQPRRHGKWLTLPTGTTGRSPCVLMHFGMTGMLLWCSPDEGEHKHDRAAFRFDGGELRFRDMRKLKGITLARGGGEVEVVLSGLGPDAADISTAELQRRLTRTRRQLKSALMDQSKLAGLGNLTVDEILWQARMSPRNSTAEMAAAEYKRLHSSMRSVLRTSCRAGRVPDRRSWLTGHRDHPDGRCPRCSWGLRQGTIASRTTVWCPNCQG